MNSNEADLKEHADAAAEFKKHADAAMDEFMNIARIPPMTLRDYFAAAGLTLAAAGAANVMDPRGKTTDEIRRIVAGEAYKLADAMLKERSKP